MREGGEGCMYRGKERRREEGLRLEEGEEGCIGVR